MNARLLIAGAALLLSPSSWIHSSRDKPDDACAAVSFRGYWFRIDDRDLMSKKIFSFIMMIFSLTETGGKKGAPIVTIPAG